MAKTTRRAPADNQAKTSSDAGQHAGGKASREARATTRRNLLQLGAGLAAMSSVPRGISAPAIAAESINVPKAPNLIVLMTDQERHHVHWPAGWAEKNLPSLTRL
jgi:hypothetical protein